MFAIRSTLATTLIAIAASNLGAQAPGTVYLGGSKGEVIGIRTDGSSVTTVISGARTAATVISGLTIGVDNRRFVAVDLGPRPRLLEIDPATASVTSVIWTLQGNNISAITDIRTDQDGDAIVLSGSVAYRITRSGRFNLYFSNFPANDVSLAEDKTTGNWLLTERLTYPPGNIHVVDRSTLRVVKTAALGAVPGAAMRQDPHAEDVYCTAGTSSLLVYRPSTNTVTTLVNNAPFASAMAIDRAPDASGGLLYVATSTALFRCDRNGANLGLVAALPTGFVARSAILAGQRNLAPALVNAPNARAIHISFPGDAGKGYVVAASISGYTTGFSVGGRHIPLDVDAVTRLSVSGSVPGVFTGNIGTLGPGGMAQATLDFNRFGAAARGIKVWLVGVSYDPGGIRQVSAPLLIVMR